MSSHSAAADPARLTRRLAVASILSALLVLAAPMLGEMRSWLRAAMPAQFTIVMNGVIAAAFVAAVATALARIRTRRAPRFALIGAALAILVASSVASDSGSASVNAVERFHFLAYGAVTFLFYRAFRLAGDDDLSLLALPAIAAIVVSVADEAFQWFVPGRVGEIRDVWLNGAAIAAGLAFSAGALPPDRLHLVVAPPSRAWLARAAAIAILALAAFVHLVHLGHRVAFGSTTFVSRYTSTELTALADDRTRSWATDPPPQTLVRFSREDQYLAEGLWHVRARNDVWKTDIDRAWRENEILERYFAPVLDHRSYAAPLSRWPPEQRADAERRATGASGPFTSQAAPIPIWTWSRAVLWAGALFGALVLSVTAGGRRPAAA